MIKKIRDRRRRRRDTRHSTGNHLDLAQGRKPNRTRKKGVRRKSAAALLLGLSTIIPVPMAKLTHAGNGKAKTKISVSTSKNRQDKGSNTIFSGPDKRGKVQLWLPPSYEKQTCKTKLSDLELVQIIKPVELIDLRPAFSFSDIVYPVSMKYDVDWRLVAAVIQAESGFNPDAVSPVGARGLMQLMPATAADYGVTLKSIHDPESNVEAGVRHLKMLSRLFDGDIPLIAAAYNAGQGTVAKFEGIPPFEETQTYVERVLSYYNSFAA